MSSPSQSKTDGRQGREPIIDAHAHVEVAAAVALAAGQPAYEQERATLAARYRDPVTADYMRRMSETWKPQLTDPRVRLEQLDEAAVDIQVVSVNPGQYYYWADPSPAAELVECINEALSTAAARHQNRVITLGTVALQHPELAAEQLERAVNSFGMHGVQISTAAGGRELSDPELEPFWEAAVANDALVFLHPLGCRELTERLNRWYLTNIVGQPTETTIALSHLIFGQVLDRYALRMLVAHGGGFLPYYVGRANHAYAHRPDSHSMLRAPIEYLRDLWFDTVVFRPEEVRHLIDAVGVERVVMGSDYPFDMSVSRPRELIAQIPNLTSAERAAIEGGNAARLLGIQGDNELRPAVR